MARISDARNRWQSITLAAAILAVLCIACGPSVAADVASTAQDNSSKNSTQSVHSRYPPGTIQSVEVADQALAQAARERADVEAQFSRDETECAPKFFTTSCLDAAKERRRMGLAPIRPIEVEANEFKRRARVVERDKALKERQDREQAEALAIAQQQKEKEVDAAAKLPEHEDSSSTLKTNHSAPDNVVNKRAIQHELKVKRRQLDAAADEKKRADNVASYEKKVRDAARHQADVANKKALKERTSNAQDASVSPAVCCAK